MFEMYMLPYVTDVVRHVHGHESLSALLASVNPYSGLGTYCTPNVYPRFIRYIGIKTIPLGVVNYVSKFNGQSATAVSTDGKLVSTREHCTPKLQV
jgi:hypothetical protein